MTTPLNTSPTRRYAGGHYVAISKSQRDAAGGIPNATVISDVGPVTNGVKAMVVRYRWNELEPSPGVYNFTRVTNEVAQCAALGVLLFVMIEDRTYDGTNPAPTDLAGKTYIFSNGTVSGYQIWRWDPVVLARFGSLISALGAQFNYNPHLGGIATQETSIGSPNAQQIAASGYTPAGFCSAISATNNYISVAFPNGRHLFFFNFLAGVSVDVGRQMLGAVIAQMQKNGTIVCGPDLVTQGAILTRCYPIYLDYHNGVGSDVNGTTALAGSGPTAGSVQHAEMAGIAPAVPQTMQALYDYGVNVLKLPIIIWDWDATRFNHEVTDIIHANPTLAPYVPPACAVPASVSFCSSDGIAWKLVASAPVSSTVCLYAEVPTSGIQIQ